MVLVSNEWQNKCEDVPNTTVSTTSTGGTDTTTASTSIPATTSTTAKITQSPGSIQSTETEVNTNNNQNKPETVAGGDSITASDSVISSTTIVNKTLANDNANEQINNLIKDKNSIEIAYNNKINDDDINECKIAKVEKLLTSATVLNYNNSIKIMAENTKESSLKDEKKDEEPQAQNFINNHDTGNNKFLDESNSFDNSNTNTLTIPQTNVKTQQCNRQQHVISHQQVPVSCPIMPQTLQSALNANNNANNSVAATGLQPNFLSQLAINANVAGLQKSTTTAASLLTAKQLNQSLNMLDSSNQNKSDSNFLEGTPSTTTSNLPVPASSSPENGDAKIILTCEDNSHPFETRTISLTPNLERMVGRLIAKCKASSNNAIFDCKVLSRKHAVIWYTPDGKFWVKDTKSSNGTFINDNKLGEEEAELHFGDIVKFGVDVLENSRKEVHGCIIASVKLYLPDGREAISIDSPSHRSPHSAEGSISYDELHRLNMYIQETSQREKVLSSKLCNIQNVLDATRKNSALCWQSMITEDQLLHRIHSLEKKLQFMEKNVPENILRNEVIKLLDDKSSYQHTAKEALSKVYQERCEAMQMLAKMESAYTQSDNECSLLRDQIMNSKQTIQEVNARLLRLEAEYNEYKDEVARQKQEAKEPEEQHITNIEKMLHERELECEDLKKKISELLQKHSEQVEDEEQLLAKQAIEKLDAAIADVGDEDSDEAENDDFEKTDKEEVKEEVDIVGQVEESKFVLKKKVRPQLASIFGESLNGVEEDLQQDISKLGSETSFDTQKQKSPPKRVKETVIMKWLQNSDINKNEGSFDIFKAICNENDEDDENDILTEQELRKVKPVQRPESFAVNDDNIFSNFVDKLKNVQKNLEELQSEMEKETTSNEEQVGEKSRNVEDENCESNNDADAKEGASASEEFITEMNGETKTTSDNQVLSNENKKYLLLKSSVDVLREAYNEICESLREKEYTPHSEQHDEKDRSSPSLIKGEMELKSRNLSPTITTPIENHTKSRLSELDNNESDSEVESLTLSSPLNSSHNATVANIKTGTIIDQLQNQLKEYQSQVITLNEKLQQSELEAQHTLEIMHVECEDTKIKMENLNKIVENLKMEKESLEKRITEFESNGVETKSSMATKDLKESDGELEKEIELEEDPVLNAINVTALEREEELVTYKERLDEQQRENIDLRNEIALLKQTNKPETTKDILLKQYLPISIIVFAILLYFVSTYYEYIF